MYHSSFPYPHHPIFFPTTLPLPSLPLPSFIPPFHSLTHSTQIPSPPYPQGFDLPGVEESVEGATEFVDIEGGGFDEGQGSENVSKDNEDLKEQVRRLCC